MSSAMWYKSLFILIIANLLFLFVSCLKQPVNPYQSHTVNFNSNGGSSVDGDVVDFNSNATLPIPATIKAGYSFSGWYSDSILTSIFCFSTTPITSDITLYANWTLLSDRNTLVDNCEGGTRLNNFGYTWFIYDDNRDGGSSTIPGLFKDIYGYLVAPTAGAGYTGAGMVLPYSLGPTPCSAGDYNYVGIGTLLCRDTSSSFDLTGARAITFYIKSNVATVVDFEVLTHDITDFAYYHSLVNTTTSWTQVTISLRIGRGGIAQPSWTKNPVAFNFKNVYQIQWQMHTDNMGANRNGAIYLDDIYINNYTFVPSVK